MKELKEFYNRVYRQAIVEVNKIIKEEYMGYKMDMSQESERHEFENLPNGWREFTISDCKEAVSKAGNDQFIFLFTDGETGQQGDVYAISTQGKRWFLKMILSACNIEAGKDGVYNWDIPNVLGKRVLGKVENSEEEWIDREGETRTEIKPKVVQVKTIESNQPPSAKKKEKKKDEASS